MRWTVCAAALCLLAADAAAQTGERPRAGTGLDGRWWFVVRTDDGRLPEAGPLPSREACLQMQDRVVADTRATSGDRTAARMRDRSFCERR